MVHHKTLPDATRLTTAGFSSPLHVRNAAPSRRDFAFASYEFTKVRCGSCERKSRCHEKTEPTMGAAHRWSGPAALPHRVPPTTQLCSDITDSCRRIDIRS